MSADRPADPNRAGEQRRLTAAGSLLLRFVVLAIFSLVVMLNVLPRPVDAQQFRPGDTAQTIERVNVREAPSTTSAIVAVLEDGVTVTVTDVVPTGEVVTAGDVTSSLWYQIRLADSTVGYVWFDLLATASLPKATLGAQDTDILSALSAVGMAPESGFLAERLPDHEFRFEGGGEAANNVDFTGSYSNFVLGMTVQWGPDPQNSRCGVYFREQAGSGNSYFLLLLPDQNVSFSVAQNADIVDSDRAFVDALRTEPQSVNTIWLLAMDENFTVYVNGQFAARFQDATFSHGEMGIAGLALDAINEVSCRFTDTWLWQLTASAVVPPTPTYAPVFPVNAAPAPAVTDRLAQVGVDPTNGSLAFQQESIVIGPLTNRPDQAVNQDFSGRYENFVLATDIVWGPGGAVDLCGVYFGSRGAGELRGAMINQRQQLILGTARLGQAGVDSLAQRIHEIRLGPDAINQLVIVVSDRVFRVYLNGEYLAQLQDETYQGGIVGVSAVRRSNGFASGCEFRDIWLWELQEPLPPVASPVSVPDEVPPFITATLASLGIAPDQGELDVHLTETVLRQVTVDSPVFIDEIATDYRNFALGTDFTWEPQEADDDCGIIFRHDGGNLYNLTFRQDGIYYNVAADGAVQPDIWLSDMVPAADAVNSLVLVGVGDTFSVYLNEQYVAQFQDDMHTFGMLALVAYNAPQAEHTTCTFTNAWIWNLGDEGPIIASPTPAPSPTPDTAILDTLDELGIAPSSGYVAATVDRLLLVLTGYDEFIASEWIGNYTDFIIESTITWGPGDAEDSCGVVLRARQGGNYYQVGVNQQRVEVARLVDGGITDLVYHDTPTLRKGAGESNTLRLIAASDLLTIYVNGEYAGQYRDLEAVEGALFLIAETGLRSEESYCVFEDVWVWNLAFAAPVILTPTPTPTPTSTPTPTPRPTASPTPRPPNA